MFVHQAKETTMMMLGSGGGSSNPHPLGSSKLGTSELLYSKVQAVLTRAGDGKEERKCMLRVTIELQTITSPTHRKELYVQVTDDTDPLFFYSLRLAEDDFQALKTQQSLLVDFHAFPSQLCQLLDRCMLDSTSKGNEPPKFLLRLATSYADSTLELVELNPFKHLCHLALKVAAGSDLQVKQYLSECLKKLRCDKETAESALEGAKAHVEERLRVTEETLHLKSAELERLRNETRDQAATMGVQLAREVGDAKEKAARAQSDLQERHEKERADMEARHRAAILTFESRLEASEFQVRDLLEVKYGQETATRELRSQLAALQDELAYTKNELNATRKRNAGLDADYHQKERMMNQLTTRVAVLEQEAKDKQMLSEQQQNLLQTATEQKHQMEAQLEQNGATLARREGSLKQVTEDLVKANEIIRKQQDEIRGMHGKVKLRSQIAVEQEKLLQEKDKELIEARREIERLTSEKRKAEEGEIHVNNEKIDIERRVAEMDKQLKTNENVIAWLNRQLSEAQTKRNAGPILVSKHVLPILSDISKSPEPPLDPRYFMPSNKGLTRKDETQRITVKSKPSAGKASIPVASAYFPSKK